MNVKNIRWLKNVTNQNHAGAYLDVNNEFNLHFPNQHMGNVLSPQINDIILLFQNIDNDTKLTHLVTPIDNIRGEDALNENYRYFRRVKTLAKKIDRPYISRSDSILRNINFQGISQGNAVELDNIESVNQNDLADNIRDNVYFLFFNYLPPHNPLNSIFFDVSTDYTPDNNVYLEGTRRLIQHYSYERNRRLITQKKDEALNAGNLFCEVCNFDFQRSYGIKYIECHHKTPLAINIERITELNDLALVCSNCHRMLHIQNIDGSFYSIDKLREIVKKRR